MSNKSIRNFYLGFVVPSILSICLFIISLYVFIIPAFEKNSMDKKKEMISELTNTAWSLIEEFKSDYKDSIISIDKAKMLAAERIEKMRYGNEGKDYFWIIDMHPNMIMHPYRKELNGTDLTEYKDSKEKKLFVEAVKIVQDKKEGYIDYIWQWKDDSTRSVPKLSYVKGIDEWNWIIGTGIYLEDVKEEIEAMEKRILRISFAISLIIILLLLYMLRQSLVLERRRKEAEEKLRLSRTKYQSLVQASIDGTVMLIEEKIIFSNQKFNEMIGYNSIDILELNFNDLFLIEWKEVVNKFVQLYKSITIETQLKCKDNQAKDIVITVSKMRYANQDGFIVITKDISKQRHIEKETSKLSDEVQTSLLLMNQPIKHFVKEFISCDLDTSVKDVAIKMTRKNQKVIFITKENDIVGVFNDKDLRIRVIATDENANKPVSMFMTSPIAKIKDNALIYEAFLLFRSKKVSHLAVVNDTGEVIGYISNLDVLEMQRNSLAYLVKEIEISEDVNQLRRIKDYVPAFVNALLESGHKTKNITRIITSLSDAISQRLIVLAIEDIGEPPCKFAFIAMGSEGRMEQTLITDQDNAIVFEDIEGEKQENAHQYFRKLGKNVNTNLDKIGYDFCDGGIMAMNEKWSQPLTVWKNNFSSWINNSDPQSLLDLSIIFDFRCVYGELKYTDEIHTHVDESVQNKAVFFQHLAQTVIKYKSPLSMFGSIVGSTDPDDSQIIDIKKILLPIISFIRIYALQNQISDTNTHDRLERIKKLEILQKPLYEELELAYNYLMLLRFRFQAIDLLNNRMPDNSVDTNQLTKIEITTIKKIFSHISELQTKLSFDFKGGV